LPQSIAFGVVISEPDENLTPSKSELFKVTVLSPIVMQ
jgi:hypothetical protein